MNNVISIAAVFLVVFGLDALRRMVVANEGSSQAGASTPMEERRERLERLNRTVQSETRRS